MQNENKLNAMSQFIKNYQTYELLNEGKWGLKWVKFSFSIIFTINIFVVD